MERARAWVESSLGSRLRELAALPGGAGARRYWRAFALDGRTAVLMYAAREDARILPPQLASESALPIPFLVVTELLAAHGLPVPRIEAALPAERWILLEDLGDRHLCDLPGRERASALAEAVAVLARAHAIAPCDALPFRRCFDREWIAFELDYFLEYGARPEQRDSLRPALAGLADRIASLPRVLALRDFQSQNLMLDPGGRLRILDYQDALLAPRELDLAALLHDSYVELTPELRGSLLEHYASETGVRVEPSALALLVVQRKLKDYARFRHVAEVKGDLRFAPFRAAARASVLSALGELPSDCTALVRAVASALGASAGALGGEQT